MDVGRLHLSIDDVTACLRDLSSERHATPWTQPTFGYLRTLHERFGVVVSLYPFVRDGTWSVDDVPDRHRDAFARASTWLRFGFHALERRSHYGRRGLPAPEARSHYERFVASVDRFAGEASLDRLPRIHRFLGRVTVVRAWRDADRGIVGLLTADDGRTEVYHLDAASRVRLAWSRSTFDAAERLHLVASLPRLESGLDVGACLDATVDDAVATAPRCLFSHEQHLHDGDVRARISAAVAWGGINGVGWGFPQDSVLSSDASDAPDAMDAR